MSEDTKEILLNASANDLRVMAKVIDALEAAQENNRKVNNYQKWIFALLIPSILGIGAMLYQHERRISQTEIRCENLNEKAHRHENYINILFQRK